MFSARAFQTFLGMGITWKGFIFGFLLLFFASGSLGEGRDSAFLTSSR